MKAISTAWKLPVAGSLLALGLTAGLHGQTPAAPAPAPTPPAKAEEVVTLSEFNVKAEPDRGYVASETLTGSRVRTPIIDLPYTVNVLTSEFFEDFGMFELADNVTQIGSFTGLDIGGGFTLRGFSATSQLRDGFYRLGRYGASNIDRMEIIKGSNAAIYGRTSPGGMVNMISKQPRDREYYKFQYNYGDFDQRGYLEATGPLFPSKLGKTSYIFTASQYQKSFGQDGQDFARNHNEEYYLAARHAFKDGSSLMLSAEYFLQIRHAPPVGAPLVTDLKDKPGQAATNLDDEAIGYAVNLARYNAHGPQSELNRGAISYTAVYDKRISDLWSVRAAGNYFRARRWDYNQNNGFGSITINNNTASANYTSTRGATPNKGLIMEDGGGVQADALAHYWLSNRTIENRTLMTIDFNDYYRWDPTWNYGPASNPDIAAWNAAGSGRVVSLTPDFRPTAPLTYFPKFLQWGQEQLTRLTRRRTTVLGGLLRHQSAFLDGKLLTYAGARFDAVRFQERDYTTAVSSFTVFPEYKNYVQGQMIRKVITQLKPNLGANYKLTPNFRVFANYSESYFVNQTDNPVVFADPTYKPEIASGYDYGFKGSLLQDRLNFTVSGFYATRENVSVSELVEVSPGTFVTQNRRDGDQLVRGYEIDANWRASDEVSVNLSWGHVYSIYTDFGSGKPLSVGRRVNGVAPENGSIAVKYSPSSGRLKGFSTNLGWTYVASTPSENPDAGDTYGTVPVNGVLPLIRTTYQWRLRVPAFGLWNWGARYNFRSGSRFDHTLAVNVNNVADKDYIKINKQIGEPRNIIFSYTLGFGHGSR